MIPAASKDYLVKIAQDDVSFDVYGRAALRAFRADGRSGLFCAGCQPRDAFVKAANLGPIQLRVADRPKKEHSPVGTGRSFAGKQVGERGRQIGCGPGNAI